ncbi:putative pilus system protein FilC [Acinetobacter puyangensis]|uniref:putative pilus system protein FilC n=1 Tax=Acinetobacter puyangensis TaxID=1096779 RepID=UPI000BE3D8AF|nr:transporter [Acinetobacter puyangensis]
MEIKWMNRTALGLSIGLIFTSQVYAQTQVAENEISEAENATVNVSSTQDSSAASTLSSSYQEAENKQVVDETPSMNASSTASEALQQQEGDATQKENLEEVFTASERQYSLLKKGSYSGTYDLDYTYYRDTQIDLALCEDTSTVCRLHIEDNANHNLTNTFTLQYGVLDNLTITASVPLVAKTDNIKDTSTAGLGDISFGARWEPFPLKQGRLPLILFGNVSTKTGDSPYEVNAMKDLSTGKGYYSVGAGASTRKYIDPVVLFASVSANYGFEETGLNQLRGSRVLDSFDPGISGGFAFGFAYSFNYDVSMTMSYQQSFNTASEFRFTSGESSKPADQSSATLGVSLGVRVSPKTIVNGSVGIGLTEDAPDVSLGLSFPLDFLGFGRNTR